jgi:hypothetical protein
LAKHKIPLTVAVQDYARRLESIRKPRTVRACAEDFLIDKERDTGSKNYKDLDEDEEPAPAAAQNFSGQFSSFFVRAGAAHHAAEIGSPHPGGSKTSQRKGTFFQRKARSDRQAGRIREEASSL